MGGGNDNVTSHWAKTEPDYVANEVTKILRTQCGEECTEVWQNVLASPEVRSARTKGARFIQTILCTLADKATDQAHKIKTKQNALATLVARSESASVQEVLKNGEPLLPATDTACPVPALCVAVELKANACNYPREALVTTYKMTNVIVLAVGTVTRLLCGCLWVADTAECFLKNVPPVCSIPSKAHDALWSQSVVLWENLKQSQQKFVRCTR